MGIKIAGLDFRILRNLSGFLSIQLSMAGGLSTPVWIDGLPAI